MGRQSAGILLYRFVVGGPEVLLVHPGGPFWSRKDANAWSMPKGEFSEGEDALEAAKREFLEETGVAVDGEFIWLGTARQAGGKTVHAWALQGDLDASSVASNTFSMEWPPKSGRQQEFPEVDRAAWFVPNGAIEMINKGQSVFIQRLLQAIGYA